MAGFTRYHFHAADSEVKSMGPSAIGALVSGFAAAEPEPAPAEARALPFVTFHNDEAAARHYLDALWSGQGDLPALAAATAPDRPEVMPDLRMASVQESPITNTRVIHFDQ